MDAQAVGLFVSALGTGISGAGLVFLAVQVRRTGRTGVASFALDLELAFQSHLTDTYTHFLPEASWSPTGAGPQSLAERKDFECYLDFFSLLNLLRRNHLLDIGLIDRLFAYRFFIAMHNPHTAQMLSSNRAYWPDLLELYTVWRSYRTDRALDIPQGDFALDLHSKKVDGGGSC